jgi:transposase
MAYDERYRTQVLKYLGKGHTLREAREVFSVGSTTMCQWKKQWEETGSLAKKELHRSFKKVDPEKLKAYVQEHPDAYLREIAKEFECSGTAIGKALKRLKITRKKNAVSRTKRRKTTSFH